MENETCILILNGEKYEYTYADCIASIRAAWAWGYFNSASIDGEEVSSAQLWKWGCQ